MDSSWKDRFLRGLALSLVVIVFIGGLFAVWPTYRRGQSLKRQEAELVERIEQKRRDIAALIENQRRFRTDPDFVEHIARQNRRVFPGELVFVFKEK